MFITDVNVKQKGRSSNNNSICILIYVACFHVPLRDSHQRLNFKYDSLGCSGVWQATSPKNNLPVLSSQR
jgi:hypothetical protein